MASIENQAMKLWISRIVDVIPCKSLDELDRFINNKPMAKVVYPKRDIIVEDHWFCVRRYHDVVTDDNIFEVYIGNQESGEEYMGYDRIDPRWLDAEGRDEGRWELTRAYMRPKYRGRNYSQFMLDLVVALAKKNKAKSVVAYPRHVAMLVTLLKNDFKTRGGNYDETLQRIYKQGKTWYGANTQQRRLYYAQEFRPFIQDGSFIMEKRVSRTGLWDFLLEKV
jgi:GNAT superfamily N-acetyltransferase